MSIYCYTFQTQMASDDEYGTPPGTPPQRRGKTKKKSKRRRSPSSSSSTSDSEPTPRKSRKYSNRLSTSEVLKLLANYKGDAKSSLSILSNNNLNNVLPDFDPANRTQTIECWLKKVNECATIYGWNDKQVIHFSLQKLVGLAKKWFESLPTVIYTWDEWQAKLRKAFPSEENYGRLLEEMLNRTSRHDESLREYFFDKLCLLNRCEIEGKKAVDCIVYGIMDRSIRNGAQALNSSEPEDLLNFLCSQKPQTPIDNKPKNRPIHTRGNPSTSSNSNLSSSVSDSIVCYNCRTRGHPYYKCTKPILKCKRCNRIGHDNEGCKLVPFTSSSSSSATHENSSERKTLKIDIGKKGNDKFFKTVTVDDQTLSAYIDFGSECTLLSESNAESLNLKREFDSIPVVRGFGQASVVPLYKSCVTLKVDEVEAEVEVLVVEDSHMQTAMIIGQNFTELPCVTVLKNSKRLTFYKSPSTDSLSCTDSSLKLHVSNSVQVLKIDVVPVHAECDFTGDVYIEGYNSVESGKEYCLLQGAYHISNGKGEVVISNMSHHAVNLERDTLVARAIPFIEQDICQVNRIQVDTSSLEPLNKNDVKTGPGLSTEQADRLYSLLQNYRDCFATKLDEIGSAVDFEMQIDLMDTKPIVYRPYRLSHAERETVRETVDELLRLDIIQESKSDYASPILMVRKKSGEQRLCVDFRALNNKTVKDRFPLPLIDDQVSNLSGNNYFTTLDLASGYYQIPMSKDSRAVKDLKTKNSVKILEKIFYDFGVPARIVSDRGTSFTSAAFKTFCDNHGIKHILNAVACPRANGQAERFNQTILNSLASQNAFGHERDWDKCLGKLQFGINNTVNASTRKSATEALFGFKLRDDLLNKLEIVNNDDANNSDLQQIRDEISISISKDQAKQKERHDANRAPAPTYEIGDLVKILRNNFENKNQSTKLLSKFVGPYKIIEILGNDRYRISDVPGFTKKGKPYNTVISVDRIRPWIHVKALELHNSSNSSSSEYNSGSE
ncbi:hypothetical protein ABMA27_001426 [Loxostege sticticalis]|uniref:Integrase catalytic domain-containing protein n=1 Tax=Loxostege sticticalis TaxID=481309 RepID=A0ABR3HYQ6_LOXSC